MKKNELKAKLMEAVLEKIASVEAKKKPLLMVAKYPELVEAEAKSEESTKELNAAIVELEKKARVMKKEYWDAIRAVLEREAFCTSEEYDDLSLCVEDGVLFKREKAEEEK
jgi:hypothetical protein